jgi:hypothetical protein
VNRRSTIAVPALAILLLAGCAPATLRTQPAPISACMDALATGTLVPSSRSGLAIRAGGASGEVTEVEWPFGYTARRDMTGLALIDSAGTVVAHEGEVIQMGGGTGADNVFHACSGSIAVVAPAQAQ